MPAKLNSVRIIISGDECPDASYLEQEGLGFEDRLAAYRNGDFSFVGVQVEAEIYIPHGSDWIIQTIKTPGLWGIEDDSGEDYFREVAADESVTLSDMLQELCVTRGEFPTAAPIVYR
jgi:hypothetical protein